MNRIFQPLAPDHPAVVQKQTCSLCRRPFIAGDVITFEEPAVVAADTVEVLLVHAACAMPGEIKFLIWSNEHFSWWSPGEHGYTPDRALAGAYPFSRAVAICLRANKYLAADGPPNEAIVPCLE
jgi:hypothetical protein